jgi:hypothetical protein
MRIFPSLVLSILASVLGTYLARRIFAASSEPGGQGSVGSIVVVFMPLIIGNQAMPRGKRGPFGPMGGRKPGRRGWGPGRMHH